MKMKDKPMSAAALAELMRKVALGWPEATVYCADEGPVICAMLKVGYDADGEENGVELWLYAEA